ncbi:carboxymuconolactone decarboxylase family protein [Nocardia sp. BMG111209]|uniref:carboxymuconolactone decarboxylase family protein n=1 Tax=Nocardia sp. BMG111209 TaxID=1160137 RepID=UPI0003A2389D|nr:carboxymuconolactone decarboxylase family protein [Nocardia sp. BMG111209]
MPDRAQQIYREVMTIEPPEPATPFEAATFEFVFGQVWSRPGLSRRERRWVTLTCVAAADSPQPIADHVYAALRSGDITLPEMLEFVLHFAVYCGWPKASHLEGEVRAQWARLHTERGETAPPWPRIDNAELGPDDWERRMELGAKEFAEVNLISAPPANTPYQHAGILNFVFGHVWQRPGLTRRDRRLITIPAVALDDSPMPLRAHVTSAVESGDVTPVELDEIVLQFSAYYGFAKGQALQDAADLARAKAPV